MRIISGTYKGKIIRAPVTLPARPTTDFAKTGLFNMLNYRFDLKKCNVLDLFAGTGNISYEFISRGCPEVTAVEKDLHCIQFIKKIFTELKAEHCSVVRANVFEYVKKCSLQFTVIYADPPYDTENYEELIEIIFEKKMLHEKGFFILEHQSKKHFSEHAFFIEERKFGNVGLSFFGKLREEKK